MAAMITSQAIYPVLRRNKAPTPQITMIITHVQACAKWYEQERSVFHIEHQRDHSVLSPFAPFQQTCYNCTLLFITMILQRHLYQSRQQGKVRSMFGLSISRILIRLIVLFLGIPIHEWAHAWSAYLLGDDTASMQGRLTLNPLAHLDPIGSLLILVSGFGWGKPVPVNPYRMRMNSRVGMAISAVAGPFSNFVLAMVLAIP